MEDIFNLRPGEDQDHYLYRLGTLKENGVIRITWIQLTDVFNKTIRVHMHPQDESTIRKRFKNLKSRPMPPAVVATELPVISEEYYEKVPEPEGEDVSEATRHLADIKRQKVMIADIRACQDRVMREAARAESLQDILREEIRRFTPPRETISIKDKDPSRALYAMLSDIHYGIRFKGRAGDYDPVIARTRVLTYAKRIIDIGKAQNIGTLYVSLMGDMISGIIHNSIRLENRENLVQQITGVGEIIGEFLRVLAKNFAKVYVNSVPGNHSRVDKSFDESTRGERLDSVVTYCAKCKLEHFNNVTFCQNEYDPTIGVFNIFGKTYVSVHGDLDTDLKASVNRIQSIMEDRIDYLLAAHMHVPDFRFEHVGFIRNGSVCGSGDDYTAKKRLFSPPYQVCLTVSPDGIESIHPVRLDEEAV